MPATRLPRDYRRLTHRLCLILLLTPVLAAPQTGPEDSDRWAVRNSVRTNGSYYAYGIKKTRCNTLNSLLARPAPNTSITTHRVGAVNGFAIYDVIQTFADDENNEAGSKQILVERKPGEFCQIFVDEWDVAPVDTFQPSYLVNVASQTVLVSRDPMRACGCFSEGYWTFDKHGPIFLDVGNVVEDAERDVVPPGFSGRSGAFDIQTLTFSFEYDKNNGPGARDTPAFLHMKFALKNHKLVLVSHEDDGTNRQ